MLEYIVSWKSSRRSGIPAYWNVVDSNNGHAGTGKLEFQRFHRLRWNVLESAGIPSPAGIHRFAGIPLRWTVLDSINGSPGTCWNSFTLEFPSWNPA